MKIADLGIPNPFNGIQAPVVGNPSANPNNLNGGIGGVVSAFLPYVIGVAGIALLIYLVLGGLQLMMSRGDPKAIQAAQGKITNALIGFIVIILAFTVVQLVGNLLGLQQNISFGTLFK